MNKHLLFIFIVFLSCNIIKTNAQCLTASITAPDTVCAKQNFAVNNNTAAAVSYYWDFCPGDLQNPPTGINLGNLGATFSQIDQLKIIKDNGLYYLFVSDWQISQITRFELGSSLDNMPVSPTILNVSGLNLPMGFDIINENGIWYMLVANYGGSNLSLLKFGSGVLDNNPTINPLNIPGLQNPITAKIAYDNNSYQAIVGDATSNSIFHLNFGNSLENIPVENPLGVVPNVSTLFDVDLIKVCNTWYGFATSLANGNIIKLEFTNGLNSIPTFTNLGNFNILSSTRLTIALEGGEFYVFVNDVISNNLVQLSFGDNILNSPVAVNLGNIGQLNGPRGLTFARDSSQNYIFINNINTGTISKLTFPDSCSAIPKISEIANPVLQYLYSGINNISLIVRDTNNSVATTDTSVIVISSIPVANFTESSPNNYCYFDSVTFNDLSISGCNLPLFWSWDFGDGNYSNLQNPSHLFEPGMYNVILTVTNTVGDSGSFQKSITITGVKPEFTVSDGCVSDSLQFINNSLNPLNTSVSWLWNLGDGNSSILSDPLHFYAVDGNYNVSLISTADGCVDTVTKSIDFYLSPKVEFDIFNTCVGQTVQFSNLTNPAPVNTTYFWDFGDGVTSTLQNPSHQYANLLGSYQVTLIANSPNGCSDTLIKPLAISNVPQALFSYSPSSTCENNPVYFTDNSTVAGDTISSWYWDFNNGNFSYNKNPVETFNNPGNYLVKLIVSAGTNCLDSTDVMLNINDAPIADFAANDVCLGDSTLFTDLSTPPLAPAGSVITNYFWEFGDSTTSTQINPVKIYSTDGVYSVTLTVTTNFGCSSSVSKVIQVKQLPVADFTTFNNCSEKNTEFYDLSTITGDFINAWEWNFDDPGSSNNISFQSNPTHFYTIPGFYFVSLKVITISGCADSITIPVEIKKTPTANFSFTQACEGEYTTFTYLDSSFPSNATNWFWDFGNGATSNIDDPATLYPSWGTYNVSLIVVDSLSGCSDTVVKPVDVDPIPVPVISLAAPCIDISYGFMDSSYVLAGAIQTWNWIINADSFTVQNPFYTFSDTGSYTISLEVVSDKGCAASVMDSIHVSGLPTADFQFSPQFGDAPLVVNFNNLSAGALSYLWEFGDGNTSTLADPIHNFNDTGLFNILLVAINEAGCADSTVKQIYIVSPLLDIGITKVFPQQNNNYISISAEVINFGTREINDFYISARVDGAPVIQEKWTGILKSGESMIYSFGASINIPDEETSLLCVTVSQPNNEPDNNNNNNKLCNSLIDNLQFLTIYPNPGNGIFTLEYNLPISGIVILDFYNDQGKLVQNFTIASAKSGYNNFIFDSELYNLSNGSYYVRLTFEGNSVITKFKKY